jgi:hypothetical protein
MFGGAQIADHGGERQNPGCCKKASAIHELPLCICNRVAAQRARSRRGQRVKLFSSEFFTVPGGFVTYSRWLCDISYTDYAKYNAAGDEYQ